MKQLTVVKIGGNVIDDAQVLQTFLVRFAAIPGAKVLVHGGGKLATELACKLDVPQTMVDGRRITNAETLDIAVMVYAGLVNKRIVSALQGLGCNAIGLSGADGNIMKSTRRVKGAVDYGLVGDIRKGGVETGLMDTLLMNGYTPVLCPITNSVADGLLNTNADTIASSVAAAMSELYKVTLTYCFEKSGVLLDAADETSVIDVIDAEILGQLKLEGIVSGGMLPKLEQAFSARESGVTEVRICHADEIAGTGGTRFELS